MSTIGTDCSNLSLVIQGNCSVSNHGEVANILMSYRKAFRNAEIIFCISSSDFIDFSKSSERYCASYNKAMDNFCSLVNEYADKIAYARLANPFPPVFRGGTNCHANHMIEAAQNGLKLASRKYVLRVRNDLLFKDTGVLLKYDDLYEKYYQRGTYTVFDMPVMISSLYTLNPFAGGRLPFHYGDWFHLGRTSDVRKIWDVPFVDLEFMTFYNSNPSLPGTKEKERNFYSRLAIEQYIHFEHFSKTIDNIYLTHQNDDRSVVQSIEILLDNFIICDIYHLGVYYPKYIDGFNSYSDNNTRIMEEDWIVMSRDRSIDVSEYLFKSVDKLRDYTPKLFPITIGSEHLLTNVGFRFGKSIIIPHDAPEGIVCFGPYIGLPRGKFAARIEVSALYPRDENCSLIIAASYNKGQDVLCAKEVALIYSPGYRNEKTFFEIEFEHDEDEIENFEIVMTSRGFIDMSIDKIFLDKVG